MRREAVAQSMGRDRLVDPGRGCVTLHDLPEALARDRLATAIDEEHTPAAHAAKLRACQLDIAQDRRPRGLAHRHKSLLAAFANRTHDAAVEVDVFETQGAQLGDAQAGRIERLQHRAIAHAARVVFAWRAQKPVDLFRGQDVR